MRRQFLEDAEAFARLLRNVPKERRQAIVLEASKQAKPTGEQGEQVIQPMEPLSEEQMGEVVRAVPKALQDTDPLVVTRVLLNFGNLIVQRDDQEELAGSLFWQLMQNRDHFAEGYFGFACVHAIRQRYDLALSCLEVAINDRRDFINRARLDEDLRLLKVHEHHKTAFAKLVQWPAPGQ